MSRHLTLILPALAILALIALTPTAYADLGTAWTRPLTVVAWKGSLIEMYINFTEMRDYFGGIGAPTYWYFKLSDGINVITDLPILLRANIGGVNYYCAVKAIPDRLEGGGMMNYLFMTFKPEEIIEYDVNGDGKLEKIEYKVENHKLVVCNITDPTNPICATTVIYREVYFPSAAEFWQVVIDKSDPDCIKIKEYCANGCWLKVVGLVVPKTAAVESARNYYIWVMPAGVTYKHFEAGIPVYFVEPTGIYIYEAGPSKTIAFGRVYDQKVELADGTALIVKGYANITINVTKIRTVLSRVGVSFSNVTVLTKFTVSGTRRVADAIGGTFYLPSWTKKEDVSTTGLLFVNAGIQSEAASYVSKVYGTGVSFGAIHKTSATGVDYVEIVFTVNPAKPIDYFNKLLKLKLLPDYLGYETYLPALEAVMGISFIDANATIQLKTATAISTLEGVEVGVSWWTTPFVLKRIALDLPLPETEKLTILPAALYENKFVTDVFGDANVINVYDKLNVTLTNIPAIGATIVTPSGEYTVATGNSRIILEAPLIEWTSKKQVGSVWATGLYPDIVINSTNLNVYFKMLGSGMVYNILYTIQDAPYAGKTYLLIPVLKLNVTPVGGSGWKFVVFAYLPPLNYTDATASWGTLPAGDVAIVKEYNYTLVRIRPFAFAVPLTSIAGNKLEPNWGTTTVPTGGYILIGGYGFDVTDPALKLFIGNYTVEFSKLSTVFDYEVVGKKVYTVAMDAKYGKFAIVVPLFKIGDKIYKVGYTGKPFYINVTGSGDNSDRVSCSSNVVCASTTYDAYATYTITYSLTSYYALINPVVVDLTTASKDVVSNTVVYLVYGAVKGLDTTWTFTPYAVCKTLKDYYALGYRTEFITPTGECTLDLLNKTKAAVLIMGYKPAVHGTYKLAIYTSAAGKAFNVTTLTPEDLKAGYYFGIVEIPESEAYTNYYFMVWNVTSGAPALSTQAGWVAYKAEFEVKRSLVVLDEVGKTATWALEGAPTPKLVILPKTTILMYGYGWRPEDITVYLDSKTLGTVYSSEVKSGSWTFKFNVTGAYAGQVFTLRAEQASGSVEVLLQVRVLLWNPLKVIVETGRVIYKNGKVMIPVLAAITYFDEPVGCDKPVTVTATVYYDVGVSGTYLTAHKIGPVTLYCDPDKPGVWGTVIDLGEVKEPKTYMIVVTVVYKWAPGLEMTQYAMTSVHVEPELKAVVEASGEAAEKTLKAVEEMKSSVETISTKLGTVSSKLDEIAETLTKLDEIYKAVTTAKTEILGAIDSLKSSVDTALATVKKEILAAIETAKSDIITEVKGVAAKLDTVASKLEDVSGKMDEVVDTVKAFESDIKEIKEKLGMLDEIYGAIVSAKSDILDAISAIKSSLEKAIAGTVDEIKKAVEESLSKTSSEIKGYIDTATETIVKKIEDAESSIVTEIKRSTAELSAKIDEKFATLDREIKALAEVTKYLAAEVAGLSKTVADLKSVVSELGSKIETVEGNVKSLEDKLASVAELVSSISDKLDTVLGKLSYLTTKVDEVKKAVEDAASKIEKSVSELGAEVAAIEKTLGEMANAMKNATKEIKSAMTTAVAEITMKIEDVKKSIVETVTSESSRVITAVRESTDRLSGEIETLGTKIDELSKKVDAVKSDLAKSVESAKETVLAELGKIEKSIADLSKTVATKEDVSEVSKKVDTLSSKLDELKGAISTIADRVESTVKSLSKDISSVASKVSDVSSKVEDVKSAVGSTNSNVMIFGAGSLVVSIIVLVLLIITALRGGLLAAH